MEVDRGVAEVVRAVEVGEEWAEVAKAAVVVVDVRVEAVVVVAVAEWVVVEAPAAAVETVPAAVVEAARAVVGKAAAAVDGRAAAVDPVGDPAAVVVAGRDRAVSKL